MAVAASILFQIDITVANPFKPEVCDSWIEEFSPDCSVEGTDQACVTLRLDPVPSILEDNLYVAYCGFRHEIPGDDEAPPPTNPQTMMKRLIALWRKAYPDGKGPHWYFSRNFFHHRVDAPRPWETLETRVTVFMGHRQRKSSSSFAFESDPRSSELSLKEIVSDRDSLSALVESKLRDRLPLKSGKWPALRSEDVWREKVRHFDFNAGSWAASPYGLIFRYNYVAPHGEVTVRLSWDEVALWLHPERIPDTAKDPR